MGNIFNLDSPLMQGLGKMADLMILNLVAMVCCIPIVTVGASMTALHYMSLKIIRGEECYVIKGFFKSFKQNFKQATLIWLLILVVTLVLAGDFYIMGNSGIEFHVVLKVIIGVAAILLLFTSLYVFPVLAKFDNTIKNTLKNAFMMSLLQFPKTLLMIVIYLIPAAIAIFIPQIFPVAFLFGLSGPTFLSAFLYNKFFKKLEARVLEASEGEENAENPGEEQEDERIFKDELDETLIAEEQNRLAQSQLDNGQPQMDNSQPQPDNGQPQLDNEQS